MADDVTLVIARGDGDARTCENPRRWRGSLEPLQCWLKLPHRPLSTCITREHPCELPPLSSPLFSLR